MRFSIKWALAGMAYVALAAVAFAKPHWAYVDLLRALAFLAVVYALVVAIGAGHSRKFLAIGFAAASVLLGTLMYLSPDSSPTKRIVIAAFPAEYSSPVGYATTSQRELLYELPNGSKTTARQQTNREANALRIQSANAVATMLAGLVGSTLGVVAWRRGGQK